MIINRDVLITLILISALGVIAIPFGNPKFIEGAIALELSFVALSILIWKGYTKPLNALILIIGGYILEGVLIYTSLKSIISMRSNSLTKRIRHNRISRT